MATIIFNNFRNAQLGNLGGTTTTVDFDADDIDADLLEGSGGDGVVHAVTHSSYDDVDGTAGAAVVADRADSTDVPLASKTVGSVAAGVFDSTGANSDVTYTSISGANDADYLTLRKYNATATNSTLILSFDSATTGLPLTPNGGDITVTWNASGILQI